MASSSCPPTYVWADNNQQMDPCEVASSLRDLCDSSLPPLKPINPGDTYPGPTREHQSACVCSSVTYVLVSACSDCQGGQVESWLIWSANCQSPSIDSFEVTLPANISIPDWANKFDVISNPSYSPSVASSIVMALQATSTSSITNASATVAAPTTTNTSQTTPTDTSTLTGSLTTTTASFGPDLSSATTSSATTENRTAVIAGGTIGAVVFLAMGAALVYWYMQRRRRTRVPPSVAYMAVHGLESSDY